MIMDDNTAIEIESEEKEKEKAKLAQESMFFESKFSSLQARKKSHLRVELWMAKVLSSHYLMLLLLRLRLTQHLCYFDTWF